MSKTTPKFVDFDNARYEDQAAVMAQSEAAGVCPFCAENLGKFHQSPIEWEGEHWVVTKNGWPYTNTRVHLLAILKVHQESIDQLSDAAAAELFTALKWAVAKYEIPGGGLVVRFGDSNYSAGSVLHLHAHIIQPDITAPNYADNPVKVKIGKYKKTPQTT
ncbi:HIT family protein [Candidatus Woesebacteria bacterium]|nr:HIT family protein [Candidatus Woesebacteria bacterium]